MKLLEWLKTREKLKDLPQETINLLEAEAKEAKSEILVNDTEAQTYVPKSRVDELTAAKNTYKQQNTDLAKQIEDLKKSAGDNEELKKQIETLQTQIKDNEKKMTEVERDAKIEIAITEAKAKPEILMHIDKSKIQIIDGKVVGLNEQLEPLKTSKTYLFESAAPPKVGDPPPAPPDPSKPTTPTDLASAVGAALKDQGLT